MRRQGQQTQREGSDLTITSTSNRRVRQIREAIRSGQTDPGGRVPCEGAKLLYEAIKSHLRIEEIYVAQSRLEDERVQSVLDLARRAHPEIVEVSDRVLHSMVDTETPQGLLSLVKLSVYELKDLLTQDSLLLVVHQMQDPGNLGTLIRSAEAFGARGVLLTRNSVSPFNAKVIRASAGSIFRLPCLSGFEIEEMFSNLNHNGFRLCAAIPNGNADFREVDYSGSIALLIGNESKGLDDALLRKVDCQIQIPMNSPVESLNASIATSIILCEAARQRTKL